VLTYPEAEEYLSGLAEALLRGPSSLTPAEREVIATFVSSACDCYSCTSAPAAAARHSPGAGVGIADRVTNGFRRAPVSEKLKALLAIAAKVQQGGRRVTEIDVARAREQGADDKAIHDTVLIAAAFCMYNVHERVGAVLARAAIDQ